MDQEKIKKAISMIIEAIGEDGNREGLVETPDRVARMYADIFSGITDDPKEYLNKNFKEEKHDEMVLIRDIPLYGVCEHHLIPFIGKANVAYIPDGKVVGLSKIARVVDSVSKKLQLQERMTTEIAEVIMSALNPKGVLVMIEAEHLCMSMRGAKKPGSVTITSAIRGLFRTNLATRQEAFSLINSK